MPAASPAASRFGASSRNQYASTGTIVSRTWDFGDGASTQPGPKPLATHTYTEPGSYEATLTVTDPEGRLLVRTQDHLVALGTK